MNIQNPTKLKLDKVGSRRPCLIIWKIKIICLISVNFSFFTGKRNVVGEKAKLWLTLLPFTMFL